MSLRVASWCVVVVAAVLAVGGASGCGDDSNTPLPSTNAITGYAFTVANNPTLIADLPATISGSSISVTVPPGTDVTTLKAVFSDNGASIMVGNTPQVSGATPNDFTKPVTYRVTAVDESFQDYVVTVTKAPATAKEITAFGFLSTHNPGLAADVAATITGTAITATVPFGTPITGMVATFSSDGTSITVGGTAQVSGTTANDFSAPVVYHVTAEDGSSTDYTVTLSVGASSAKAITAFSFPAVPATGTIAGTAIAVTVPFGTDVTTLVATFSTTGASVKVGATVQQPGTTINNFTNPVTYRVTAADSSTQDYTVTVTIAPNTAKVFDTFTFTMAHNAQFAADVDGTIAGTAITATLPTGSTDTALVASFTVSPGASVKIGATTQVSGATVDNFTNPVTYRVTAADTTFQDYTVTVTIMP